MNSPESPPWGFLQWAVAGLASIGASAAAFVWRLMTRIHTLEIVVGQHQRDLDVSQSANESALLRLAERLALLHDDHYRLRETIGGLPSRADIHDLELRLGERMDSLAARPRFRPASFLMMPLVAAGRHLSSKASDWPPMPRRSSNRGQSFGADLPDNNRPMDNLLGFFSFHIRACPTANPSA
jgi:hypothetical protein